jgi:hypothetical protein
MGREAFAGDIRWREALKKVGAWDGLEKMKS